MVKTALGTFLLIIGVQIFAMDPDELLDQSQRNQQFMAATTAIPWENARSFDATQIPFSSPDILHSSRRFIFNEPDEVKQYLDDFKIRELLDSCSERLLNKIHTINYLKSHPIQGVNPTSCILLWGPEGSGKSDLPLAIALKTRKRWTKVPGSALSNEYKNSFVTIIDELFDPVIHSQEDALIALDEISGFTKRQSSAQVDPGAVEYLLTKLDQCKLNRRLLVMFTDNTLDEHLPKTLRDRAKAATFYLGHPHTPARERMLVHYLSPLKNSGKKSPSKPKVFLYAS